MKYSGKAGFSSEPVETRPGTFQNQIKERVIKGDVLRNNFRYSASQKSTIDDINISNQLSIVMDPYLRSHIGELVWVSFMGNKWKVSNVSIQPPRVILDLGGLYGE